MEIETNFSRDIRVAGENPQADASCRRLLANKEMLARILKGCVAEYADCDVRDIADKYIEGTPQVNEVLVDPDATNTIRGMANEDSSPTEGRITYNIRFAALVPGSEECIGLIINIEPQKSFRKEYPLIKRAIYYCSRMISAQNGTEFTHSHYEKIKKVYSIWICLVPPKERRNTITQYYITEKNIVGNVKESVKDYDLMSVVMVCLGDEQDNNPDILNLLNMTFSDLQAERKIKRLKDEFQLRVTEELESEVLNVCDLREVFFEQGMERGIERGMERGMERGIAIGRTEERIALIHNIMQSMNCSAEYAIEILRIPEAERKKYLELMQQ